MPDTANAPAFRPISMTGFARIDGAGEVLSWVWEVRSVNGKGLDVRGRYPGGYEGLDTVARTEAPKHFKRGNLSLNLTVTQTAGGQRHSLNTDLVGEILALARELEATGAGPQKLDAILAVRGVIEVTDAHDTEAEARDRSLIERDLTAVFARLAAARAEEGARLVAPLSGALDQIEALVAEADGLAATRPPAIRDRLMRQIEELLGAEAGGADPARLAQEVAILAAKADIREELDRLRAHIGQARALLAQAATDAVGRRLDFLCQEFNREANTLCSKSTDTELTRVGLSLKSVIEQFREQIQNIE